MGAVLHMRDGTLWRLSHCQGFEEDLRLSVGNALEVIGFEVLRCGDLMFLVHIPVNHTFALASVSVLAHSLAD